MSIGTEGEPVVADQIIVYPSTFHVGEWSRSKTNKTQLDVRCSQVVSWSGSNVGT